MKELMLGNKAVARGLYEAGCGVISSYPGTPSTEITEEAAKYPEIYCEWAPNEKVALEVAHGAAVGGKRAACCMKHVGLNVAADPLFTISYQGVEAGLVICVADDPGMFSSQNEQDSRHYAIAAKLPMLEPASSQECLDFAKAAFELSEEYDTPVLLRLCTRISHSQSIVETGERADIPRKPYVKDGAKYIMMPGNAIRRHPIVEERTKKLAQLAENCPFNRVEMGGTDLGIITSGTCYQYVKEVFGDSVSVLKLGMLNPMPEKLIRDFAAKVKRLVVVEELDGVIETHVRTLGLSVEGKELFTPLGEYSQKTIAQVFGLTPKAHLSIETPIPARPPMMCAGCPHRGMYYVLAKNKCTAIGDIGCYTLGALPPFKALSSCVDMGASITMAKGAADAGLFPAIAVIGDSTFTHSGMTGLLDAVNDKSNITVIISDNLTTGMTGGQDSAGTNKFEAICIGLGVEPEHVRVVVPLPKNMEEITRTIREEIEYNGVSVIIPRRECIQTAARHAKERKAKG